MSIKKITVSLVHKFFERQLGFSRDLIETTVSATDKIVGATLYTVQYIWSANTVPIGFDLGVNLE